MGVDPITSCLASRLSTVDIHPQTTWLGERVTIPHFSASKAGALPVMLSPKTLAGKTGNDPVTSGFRDRRSAN